MMRDRGLKAAIFMFFLFYVTVVVVVFLIAYASNFYGLYQPGFVNGVLLISLCPTFFIAKAWRYHWDYVMSAFALVAFVGPVGVGLFHIDFRKQENLPYAIGVIVIVALSFIAVLVRNMIDVSKSSNPVWHKFISYVVLLFFILFVLVVLGGQAYFYGWDSGLW